MNDETHASFIADFEISKWANLSTDLTLKMVEQNKTT